MVGMAEECRSCNAGCDVGAGRKSLTRDMSRTEQTRKRLRARTLSIIAQTTRLVNGANAAAMERTTVVRPCRRHPPCGNPRPRSQESALHMKMNYLFIVIYAFCYCALLSDALT
jgi:hypothetical protein